MLFWTFNVLILTFDEVIFNVLTLSQNYVVKSSFSILIFYQKIQVFWGFILQTFKHLMFCNKPISYKYFKISILLERKAGPLLPLPDLSGPDRYSFNHHNLVDVIILCNVGCLRPTDNQ